MKLIQSALLAAMFLFVSSLQADLRAYLDPGTGSVALQVILGGVVGLLAALRVYWDRVKRVVRRTRVAPDPTPHQH